MNCCLSCTQARLRRTRRLLNMIGSRYRGYLSPSSSGHTLNISSTRFLGFLILTLFCPFYLVAQEVADIVRVDVDLVTLNVSVRDGKGWAMPDLKSDNFLVTDQGEVVSLASLASDGPASVAFVVDISSSMKGIWKSLLKGLKTFLDQSPKENDYSLIIF